MKFKGVILAVSLGVLLISPYAIVFNPESSTIQSQYYINILKGVFTIAMILCSILTAIYATKLRLIGIIGCSLFMLGIGSGMLAQKYGGASMGSIGWVINFYILFIVCPLSLLLSITTCIASLYNLITEESSTKRPIFAAGSAVALGYIILMVFLHWAPDPSPILASTQSGDKNDRLYAVRQLREIKNVQIIPALIEMLDDDDSQFREVAAYSLGGQSRGYLSIDPLIEALEDENAKVRKTALFSLNDVLRSVGKKKARRAPVPLIDALHDEDHIVRMAAAQSLGWFGDTTAVEPLINALGDNDFLVNMWVHKSLIRITGQKHLDDDPAKWRKWLQIQAFKPRPEI